jgi:hypothetical protein
VHGIIQAISFKNTRLLKRGIWLSAAVLIVSVLAPSLSNGSLGQNPLPSLFALSILSGFFAAFLWKTQIHRLVDEVTDCEDHLRVRRGPTEDVIPFSRVIHAEVVTSSGLHRISVRVHDPAQRTDRIDFLPQASLWSNPLGVQRVAQSLTDRANLARG